MYLSYNSYTACIGESSSITPFYAKKPIEFSTLAFRSCVMFHNKGKYF